MQEKKEKERIKEERKGAEKAMGTEAARSIKYKYTTDGLNIKSRTIAGINLANTEGTAGYTPTEIKEYLEMIGSRIGIMIADISIITERKIG